jgi:hypothetical protein
MWMGFGIGRGRRAPGGDVRHRESKKKVGKEKEENEETNTDSTHDRGKRGVETRRGNVIEESQARRKNSMSDSSAAE